MSSHKHRDHTSKEIMTLVVEREASRASTCQVDNEMKAVDPRKTRI